MLAVVALVLSPPSTKLWFCSWGVTLIFIYQQLIIRPFSDAPVLG